MAEHRLAGRRLDHGDAAATTRLRAQGIALAPVGGREPETIDLRCTGRVEQNRAARRLRYSLVCHFRAALQQPPIR